MTLYTRLYMKTVQKQVKKRTQNTVQLFYTNPTELANNKTTNNSERSISIHNL